MKGLDDILRQARDMQSKMADIQATLADSEIEGRSGAGMIAVILNGKGEMKRITIDPGLIDSTEKEVLEDLIVAAHADAKVKLDAFVADKMSEMTGGLPLPPGLKLPF